MTIEDDDIAEMLSGPISLEGLAQIRPLPDALVLELQEKARELARRLHGFAWDCDRHRWRSLDCSAQDLLESAKGIATQANEIRATIERKVGT